MHTERKKSVCALYMTVATERKENVFFITHTALKERMLVHCALRMTVAM